MQFPARNPLVLYYLEIVFNLASLERAQQYYLETGIMKSLSRRKYNYQYQLNNTTITTNLQEPAFKGKCWAWFFVGSVQAYIALAMVYLSQKYVDICNIS